MTSRKVDLFIVPVTPHDLIIHVRIASLPWRAIAELGLERNAIPFKIKISDTVPEIIIQKRHLDHYIRLFKSSYEEGNPIYDKQMATKYSDKLTYRLKSCWRWVKNDK
ncbi:MAG: hypothetical protein ACI9YE_000584 [Psychroserpens sp.]